MESEDHRLADGGRSLRRVLTLVGWPLLATYAMLPLTFLLPLVDSTQEPFVDLTSRFAASCCWVAHSGGALGGPILAVAMLIALVTRRGLSGQRRLREVALVAMIVAMCAGGGAVINEDHVKPLCQLPRPNIAYLAGADGAGPLKMSSVQFYATGDKAVRSDAFRTILEANPAAVPLSPLIREHWIEETGYSFPSGHSFSAMFLATFFLALAASHLSGVRLWLCYLLLPWAVAVCYSRPLLRVHTPLDITVGGLEGLLLGVMAFVLVRGMMVSAEERRLADG